jgi:hypothetical protein
LVAATALPSELNNQADNPYSTTIKPLNLPFDDSKKQKKLFVTLQFLDIYSTYRALKYNCVYEMNPLLGTVPTVPKMLTLKFITQYSIIEDDLSKDTMIFLNGVSGLVVINNYQVWNKARKVCGKR